MISTRTNSNYSAYPRKYTNKSKVDIENGGPETGRNIAKSTYMNVMDSQRILHQTPSQPTTILGQQDTNRLFATPHRARHTKPELTGANGVATRPVTRATSGNYLTPGNVTTATAATPIRTTTNGVAALKASDSTPTTYPTYNSGRTWQVNSPRVESTYTKPVRTVAPVEPVIRTVPAPVRNVTTPVRTIAPQAPVVERKLIYVDPATGLRMMKVCTPNGTIKRIEVLDNVPEAPINAELDPETEAMIRDAKDEFYDPEVEYFDTDGYPVKIEASKDGRFVFYGGEHFGTLERRSGWLTNEGIVHYDRSN